MKQQWAVQLILLGVVAAAGIAGFATDWAWIGAIVLGLAYSVSMVLADLVHKRIGTDVLATLALAGTLLVGEYLAGMLIALMLATGQVLEGYARRRAHRDLDALADPAPRVMRIRPKRLRSQGLRTGSRSCSCRRSGPRRGRVVVVRNPGHRGRGPGHRDPVTGGVQADHPVPRRALRPGRGASGGARCRRRPVRRARAACRSGREDRRASGRRTAAAARASRGTRTVSGTRTSGRQRRGHAETEPLAARLQRHLSGPAPLRPAQLDDLRATQYGLEAVLTPHFEQEEQAYFALAEPDDR